MSRRKLARSHAVLASCATLVLANAAARGVTTLVSEAGPVATFTGGSSLPVNFTNEGNAAWVFYPSYNNGNNSPNVPQVQKNGANVFSALVALTPGSGTGFSTVGSARSTLGTGVTASATATDAAGGLNFANYSGYTYVSPSSSQVGYGMQATYNIAAGATQNLAVYCYTLSGLYAQMKLTETDGAVTTTLYTDPSSGVLLPVTTVVNKQGGVYDFSLSNTDSVMHTLTLSYALAGVPTNLTGGQLGFEGMTAGNIVQPNSSVGGIYDLSASANPVAGLIDGSQTGGTIGSSSTGQNLSLILSPAAGTVYSYSGTIANNVGAGSGNVVSVLFSGPGTQALLGANTYSGVTNISGGTLQVATDGNLGASGGALNLSAVTATGTSSPAALQIYGTNATFSTARAITLYGPSTLDTGDVTNTASFTGNLNNGTYALTLAGSGNGTYTGVLGSGANTGTVVKSGTGTWALTNTDTYTGATTVNAGTLSLSGFAGSIAASAVTVASGAAISIDSGSGTAVASVTRAKSLTLSGNNVLSITGSSTNNSNDVINGALAISGGSDTITITPYAGTFANFSASSLTRTNGAVALINGVNLGMNGAAGALDVGRVRFTTAPAFVGSTTLGGLVSGTTKTLGIIPYLQGEVGTVAGSGGTASGVPDTFLTYNSSTGVRPLDLTNEFTSNALTAGTNTLISTSATATANVSINSLVMSGGTVNVNNGFAMNVASGAVLFDSATANQITIQGNTGTSTTGTLNFPSEAVLTVNSGSSATITGTYGNTIVGGQITKAGAGTLTLNTTGVTPGAVNILAGTIALQGGSTISDTGLLTIAPAATLDYTGDTGVTVDAVAGVNIGGSLKLGAVTLRSTSVNSTISGVVSGTGGIDFGSASAAATLTISNVQTYTGPTLIDIVGVTGTTSDTIKLTAANALASSSCICLGNTSGGVGILDLAGTNQSIVALNGSGTVTSSVGGAPALTITGGGQTFSGAINNGSGTMSLLLEGSETFTGVNNYTGPTNVSSGSLIVSSTGFLNTSSPIYVGPTGSVTIAYTSPTFTSTVNVYNAGTGALNFNATTGTVTIGTLGGTGNTNFASAATITTFTGGVATIAGAGKFGTISGGTVTIGGAGTIGNVSAGTVTLNAASTISNVSAGTVNLNAASTITALYGGTINLASVLLTISNGGTSAGSITGLGGVNLSGGKLTLSGINNYSGGTSVYGTASLIAGAVNALSPNSAYNISGTAILDVSGFNNSIASLIVGSTATLNLSYGTVLTDTGSAKFGGTLNILGAAPNTGLPETLMTFASYSGSFNSVTGVPVADRLVNTGTALQLQEINPASLTYLNSGKTWDNGATASFNGPSGATAFYTGDNVKFDDSFAGSYAVTISGTVSPGSTTFNNSAGSYTVAGFNASSGIAGSGSLTLLGSGTVTLSSSNTYTGGTFVNNGKLVLSSPGALPANSNLSIGSSANSATVQLAAHAAGANAGLITLNQFNISGTTNAWNGKLDLTNNAMIVHGGSIGDINNMAAQGYAGGTWNGTSGIVSSSAFADSTYLTAIGVATGITGTFQNTAVTATDVLVKYTYYGDANLDGQVTSTDYTLIDGGYLSQGQPGALTGWQNGDFNYDSVINGSDYTLIDNAFNQQGAQLSSQIATATAQIAGAGANSAVPEPASLSLIALGALGLLGRRRAR